VLERGNRLPLACITRCDKVDEELLHLMREAGFVTIGFSLESASPRILRAIGKVQAPRTRQDPTYRRERRYLRQLERSVTRAKGEGFSPVYASCMIGLPGENLRQGRATVRHMARLGVDHYQHNLFSLFPGTSAFGRYREDGFVLDDLDGATPFPHTIHPYRAARDVAEAANSTQRSHARVASRQTAELLALGTADDCARDAFRTVIYTGDSLDRELLCWLGGNLAVGGTLVHLGADAATMQPLRDAVRELFAQVAPTTDYRSYVESWDDGSGEAVPRLAAHLEVPTDRKWTLTRHGAERWFAGRAPTSLQQAPVCMERTSGDSRALLTFFARLDAAADPLSYLAQGAELPAFERLCRWVAGASSRNCETLSTAIVDGGGAIRLCWGAQPVAVLPASRAHVMAVAAARRAAAAQARGCPGCMVADVCAVCAEPAPLTAAGYCDQRRRLGRESAAEYVRVWGG
jgi:hypothetical protein